MKLMGIFEANSAAEAGGAAALTFLTAVFRSFSSQSLLPFLFQESLSHAAVDKVPGKYFVQRTFPMGVKVGGQPAFRHGCQPSFIVVVLSPGVLKAAFFVDLPDYLTKPSVPSGQHTFHDAGIRLMPVVFDALLV